MWRTGNRVRSRAACGRMIACGIGGILASLTASPACGQSSTPRKTNSIWVLPGESASQETKANQPRPQVIVARVSSPGDSPENTETEKIIKVGKVALDGKALESEEIQVRVQVETADSEKNTEDAPRLQFRQRVRDQARQADESDERSQRRDGDSQSDRPRRGRPDPASRPDARRMAPGGDRPGRGPVYDGLPRYNDERAPEINDRGPSFRPQPPMGPQHFRGGDRFQALHSQIRGLDELLDSEFLGKLLSLMQENVELKAKLQVIEAETAAKLEVQEIRMNFMQEAVERLNAGNEDEHEDDDELEEEFEELEEVVEELEEERDELLDELASLEEELERTRGVVEETRERAERENIDLREAADRERAEMIERVKLEAAEEVENLRNRLEAARLEMQEQLESQQREAQELREMLERERETKQRAAEELQVRARELEAALVDARRRVEEQQTMISETEVRARRAEDEMRAAQQQMETHLKETSELEHRARTLELRVMELEAALEKAESRPKGRAKLGEPPAKKK